MGEFASKGVAGAGLGLGIAGTGLGVLNAMSNGGLLNGLFGGRNCGYGYKCGCSENQLVNRYELQQEQKIAKCNNKIY